MGGLALVSEGAVILARLLANPSPAHIAPLRALVNDRIWYATSPPPTYLPAQGGAVLFRRRGGDIHYSNGLAQPSMLYECYADTTAHAEDVYVALVRALHDQSGPGIKQALLEQSGQPLEDPETGWPFVLCAFQHWLNAQAQA